MNSRRKVLVVVLACLAIALVCRLYFSGGAPGRVRDSNAPRDAGAKNSDPLDSESLSPVRSAATEAGPTKARADNGGVQKSSISREEEKEQASQQFRNSLRCHNASVQLKDLQSQIDACTPIHPEKWDKANLDLCKESIRLSKDVVEKISRDAVGCDPNPTQMELTYVEAVSNAAELGDADAQICFLKGEFQFSRDPTSGDVERFKKKAVQYAQEGFKRGDWRVVALLGQSGNHLGGWIVNLPIGDFEEVYRMNRLQRLAATEKYAQFLDMDVEDAHVQLSPDQVARAGAWARQMYDQYFKNSPPLTDVPEACPAKPGSIAK